MVFITNSSPTPTDSKTSPHPTIVSDPIDLDAGSTLQTTVLGNHLFCT
jgi:hypothetical protein